MTAIDSELDQLDEIYRSLKEELQTAAPAFGEYLHVLQQAESAGRIVTALAGVALESTARARIAALCIGLRTTLEVAEKRIDDWQRQKEELRSRLNGLNAGGLFLQSIQRRRENHPKFIDACQ